MPAKFQALVQTGKSSQVGLVESEEAHSAICKNTKTVCEVEMQRKTSIDLVNECDKYGR